MIVQQYPIHRAKGCIWMRYMMLYEIMILVRSDLNWAHIHLRQFVTKNNLEDCIVAFYKVFNNKCDADSPASSLRGHTKAHSGLKRYQTLALTHLGTPFYFGAAARTALHPLWLT